MRARRAVVGGGLAALAAAFARRRKRAGDRVELRYADGSMVELDAGAQAGDDLLALARRALREARPA